jgi:hypothetical protein
MQHTQAQAGMPPMQETQAQAAQIALVKAIRICCLLTRICLPQETQAQAAQMGLAKATASLTLDPGVPSPSRTAEVSLHCAEILNKWAASLNEYSKDIMVRAAEYALQAKETYALQAKETYRDELQTPRSEVASAKYAESLYWMGLNFATLCRLGGGSKWGCQQSYDIANGALAECQKLRTGKTKYEKEKLTGTILSS